jgi:hypothetical protein
MGPHLKDCSGDILNRIYKERGILMALHNDPYGIESMKSREKLIAERKEKNDLIFEQIAKELKNISERSSNQ